MSKKKDIKQVINNIRELNLEIDYDKLAEAIVKAQNKSQEIDEEGELEALGLFKTIWYIIVNKKKTSGNVLPEAMSSFVSIVFNVLSILFATSGLWCLHLFAISLKYVATDFSVIFDSLKVFALFVLTVILALLMRGIANDISWEKNKPYIVSVFSGIVSFAALIVALVALFKGVG